MPSFWARLAIGCSVWSDSWFARTRAHAIALVRHTMQQERYMSRRGKGCRKCLPGKDCESGDLNPDPFRDWILSLK